MEERIFHVLMRELCSEMGIKMEKLSYGWILQLTKDGKIRHITGNCFDINPEAAGNIAGDKYATFEVLNSQNVPVVKHVMVFNPTTMGSYVTDNGNYLTVANEFIKYGKLVVKPNHGFQGNGVTLCNTLKETEIAIQKTFRTHGSVSVCPYYDIKTEFRTFYLNGEVYLIYGKTKPYVIGNNSSTLGELIEKLNLPDKKIVHDNLSELDLTYVPDSGEKVEISWKHNLSGGATPSILPEGDLYSRIKSLALQAGKAMNINFATIDIIQTTDDELFVLEINSGVCSTIFTESISNGYDIMKNIYRKALEKLFE